ncbi:hypothetical protein [Bacillus sp. REN10]|uniref:hypothetical protein n=1 Tax=Bacillus sp. REN10 TaxID=2782541 RepID=UPI001EEEEA42|nr:hypothetical protein [Bacillus sp. REN10]
MKYEKGAAISIIDNKDIPIPIDMLATIFFVNWMIAAKVMVTIITTSELRMVYE